MKILREASEDEMVAVFLDGELRSERFASAIEAILDVRGIARRVIEEPDLDSAEENDLRRRVLGEFRGFRWDVDNMLRGLPVDDIRWVRAALSVEEVLQIRYIDWDYWLEVSGGSRLPVDAHARVGDSPTYAAIRERVRANDQRLPPLIVVGHADGSGLVVIEGHVRLTAYTMVPEGLRDGLEVLAGLSDRIDDWGLY